MSFPGSAEEQKRAWDMQLAYAQLSQEVWDVDTSEIVCHNNKHYTTMTYAEEV